MVTVQQNGVPELDSLQMITTKRGSRIGFITNDYNKFSFKIEFIVNDYTKRGFKFGFIANG